MGFNPALPVSDVAKIAVKSEAAGYESIWMHESLFQRGAISYLSFILNATKGLKAASGVINTYTRHPLSQQQPLQFSSSHPMDQQ